MATRKFTVSSETCVCLTNDGQIYAGIYRWVCLASTLRSNNIYTYLLRRSGIRRMVSPTKGNSPLSILKLDTRSGRFLVDFVLSETIRRGPIVDMNFD